MTNEVFKQKNTREKNDLDDYMREYTHIAYKH